MSIDLKFVELTADACFLSNITQDQRLRTLTRTVGCSHYVLILVVGGKTPAIIRTV